MVKLTWYFAEHFEWGGDLESTYQSYSSIVCAIRVFANHFSFAHFTPSIKSHSTHIQTHSSPYTSTRGIHIAKTSYTPNAHTNHTPRTGSVLHQPTNTTPKHHTNHTHTHTQSQYERTRALLLWLMLCANKYKLRPCCARAPLRKVTVKIECNNKSASSVRVQFHIYTSIMGWGRTMSEKRFFLCIYKCAWCTMFYSIWCTCVYASSLRFYRSITIYIYGYAVNVLCK